MIKALVSIEADLPSSQAIRFACQLGGLMRLEVHPLYIKDAPSHDLAMGAGWAGRTWEKEIIREGQEEISKLVRPEMDFCPVLKEALVIYGDKEAEALKIIEQEKYDLFVEGAHFHWTPQNLLKRFQTKLYKHVASPLILVRSLTKLNRVLLLCLDVRGAQILSSVFKDVWRNCSVPLVLGWSEQANLGAENADMREAVGSAKDFLTRSGCTVSIDGSLKARPGPDDEQVLRDYGLVAIAPDRNLTKDGRELEWLGTVSNAALLAFR